MEREPVADPPARSVWLVAAWSGMGGVGQIAAQYLAQTLAAQAMGELTTRPWFEPHSVLVREGLARFEPAPSGQWLVSRDPARERDLLILLGQAQPTRRLGDFCEHVLDVASIHGVGRVVTFAALASPVHPAAPPRVVGAATDRERLEELRRIEVTLLSAGQIGGLNGLLLGAAAERGLPGLCLLGEFPFFASDLPQPRSSAAVLRAFRALAGIDLDLEPLERKGAEVERRMIEMLERLEDRRGEAGAQGEDTPEDPAEEAGVAREVEQRIEALFERAAQDRTQALKLKAELDRHGLFRRYEDRFLDLFRKAE